MKRCKTCFHSAVCSKAKHIENYRIEDCEHYSGWISVKERLPDKSGKYIVYNGFSGNVYQAKFYTYGAMRIIDGKSVVGHWGQRDKGKNITHWQPLPEPPKEGV